MDFVTFTLIVDDIVFPDGRTAMACLGGGGPQTAFGVRLWAQPRASVGLAAGVGEDLPPACKDWFSRMNIDTSALVTWSERPTLRAWQVLEDDGRRTQVWRVPVGKEVQGMLRPQLHVLPPPYQKARAYHAGVHPSGLDVPFIRGLRASRAQVVSIEPYTHATEPVSLAELMALLSSAHIFSPNEREAASLVGEGPSLEVIGRLVELGAQLVTLRRGAKGVIVHRADTKETWEVPAYHKAFEVETGGAAGPSTAQKGWDPTGCGNAFCGGFLVGWVETGDLLTAALQGSVAASYMLECEGIPSPDAARGCEASKRLEELKARAKLLNMPSY